MRISILAAATISMLAVTPASAASLLTSSAGYTGPSLNLSGFDGSYYTFTAGPVTLPGGITYTSTYSGSVIGKGGYGLNNNGFSSTTLIVGTNSPSATVTFTFAAPVSQFGGGFNYARNGSNPDGAFPVISAFDAGNNLIASYNLFTQAPINTPGGIEVFQFRGIDGGGTGIKSFTMSGAFIILSGSTVPEPTSWVMMIAGFGLVGAAMRRRAAALAA
jgi:hypothetical protein